MPASLPAETGDNFRHLFSASVKPFITGTGASQKLNNSEDATVLSRSHENGPFRPSVTVPGEFNTPREVEIPLHADAEFFQILQGELSALNQLQERERQELDFQIKLLRETIVKTTNTTLGRSGHASYTWREIFRLYIESQVFFSTNEFDSGERTSAQAQQQLVKYQESLSQGNRYKKLGKDGRIALESFLRINSALLQNQKFQEINRIALRKILKKFDKRTALRVYPAIPLLEPFLTQNIARLLCQSISQELLTIVPQINDYLCPICLSIAFKPVRLRCNHVFCIRCLVVMQQARQNQCALCREDVVMEATSDNLDRELLVFLSTVFPKETKAKQKENERAASRDLYGTTYDACVVM
ncbi:predicted protein [Uncinocarpus reesii 1704]|uniref:RING-14 protein n=1 Tax=Uncinocarpus reesii (strain UAMH 1704) TaxID=336963 RepID=C4JWQ3_UNCRE|nr:uncharacterized protein UREG_06995 [Uncinocarpus reesii 1704]EEP82130.1 predicted protein [Uncinocarpus reesii 1704]